MEEIKKQKEEEMMKGELSPNSTFFDQISSFDVFENDLKGSSLGFMDLLGVQDFGSSIFEFSQSLQPPSPPPLSQPPPSSQPLVKEEVMNLPATPNSSSISSSSNEIAIEKIVEEEDHDKTKKVLKPKKKSQKRQREPRFAFMTKSEVDHLEDGYRWRKYGQKAVKNSPFPRSYYRCTNVSCGVKKRVERSCEDSTIVVTTYEGQHTHPSPVVPRSSPGGIPGDSASFGAAISAYTMPSHLTYAHYNQHQSQHQLPPPHHHHHHQHHQSYFHGLSSPATNFNSATTTATTTTTTSTAMPRDHGLLEDLVPSDVRRED